MKPTKQTQEELIKKFQQAIVEMGFKPEIHIGQHESVVFAQAEGGEVFKIVAQITTGEPAPDTKDSAPFQILPSYRLMVAMRPSFARPIGFIPGTIANADI
jgi:hypothetical protein